jgi:hypothetical protein
LFPPSAVLRFWVRRESLTSRGATEYEISGLKEVKYGAISYNITGHSSLPEYTEYFVFHVSSRPTDRRALFREIFSASTNKPHPSNLKRSLCEFIHILLSGLSHFWPHVSPKSVQEHLLFPKLPATSYTRKRLNRLDIGRSFAPEENTPRSPTSKLQSMLAEPKGKRELGIILSCAVILKEILLGSFYS